MSDSLLPVGCIGCVEAVRQPRRALTGSETSALILARDERQGYAEGLKAGGAAQLEAQDQQRMEGHWAAQDQQGDPVGAQGH